MRQPPAQSGRTRKNAALEDTLRERFISGGFAAGSRLPTRAEIGAEFGVGQATVQTALDALGRDGFIEARGRNGTFAAPLPPHLHRIALVFPHAPGSDSQFFAAVKQAAKDWRGASRQLQFTEVYIPQGAGHEAALTALTSEIRRQCFTAVLLVFNGGLAEPEICTLADTGVPCALLSGFGRGTAGCVGFEPESFHTRALEHLTQQGCRRVAHLGFASEWSDFETTLRPLHARFGLELQPHWLLELPFGAALAGTRHLVDLLLRLPPATRPDGLVIHDDNLVPHAAAGLLQTGIRVPGDLRVVADCNFPAPAPSPLPLTRLGYDCRELLRLGFELCEKQRAGKQPPAAPLRVTAVFERELAVSGKRQAECDGGGNGSRAARSSSRDKRESERNATVQHSTHNSPLTGPSP